MNEIITDYLASQLVAAEFLSVTAGVVQELLYTPKGGQPKKIPAVKKIYRKEEGPGGEVVCQANEDYYDLIPKSSEVGILYFEDMGSVLKKTTAQYGEYESKLKLVCWLNLKKIGYGNPTDLYAADIIRRITPPSNIGFISALTIKAQDILPKRPSPFENYGYNEAERQYITHPYDYFSILLTAKGRLNTNCLPEISIHQEECN